MPKIIPTGHEVVLGSGKILELLSYEVDIAGKKKMFEKARRSPGVRAIIIDADQRILLSREYRAEQGKYDYRLPGGKVIDTLDEYKSFSGDIRECARGAVMREVQEEVGIIARGADFFVLSKCGANVEWDLYCFLITEFEDTGEHDRDNEGESDITTDWYTRSDIEKMIRSGEMSEDRSIGVLWRYFLESSN